MMKLADDITIRVAGELITLRPSLRHAIRLERRHGSFAALAREVMDGSLTAAIEIIEPQADGLPFLPNRVLDELPRLQPALLAYVMALAGIDPDEAPKGKADNSNSQSFADYLSGLYRIGTGWLGWTPADTLDATPAEIIEAHKGRLEMLRAVFGGKEETAKPSAIGLDDKFKVAFGSFGTTNVQRRKAA